MQTYKRFKQLLAVSTAACLAIAGAGSLTGCGSDGGSKNSQENAKSTGTDGNSTKDSGESQAMGRYLENELAVPEECMQIISFQILEDGTMEMIARNGEYELCLYQSSDQGQTWDEGKTLASLFGLEGTSFYNAALGKDGSILGGVFVEPEDDNSMGSMDYYYCPAGGEGKKLELGSDVQGSFAWDIKIGTNGNLFLQFTGKGIVEINPSDGSVVHEYETGKTTDYMGVTSEYLIVIAEGDVHYYDVASGKPAEGGDALTAQLKKTPSNLEFGNSSGTALMFMDGDEEGTLFYVDSTGLYRYAFGGNVIEQVIDGSLNSLGSSNKAFNCIARDPDGKIYVGVIDYSSAMEGKLFSYTYSADTPTVPDTELTIYSLEDNSSIRQAVAMFQKKYPDVYVTLETGMSGEDGVTRTDALKTLNTEIMAGKGPDLLIMDGISSETYVEQGMLEDLSGILKDAGILSNIQNAYTREDGSIYEMPVKFAIPMIEGQKEDVEAITDITSLADVVESHKEEYGPSDETFYKFPFVYSLYPATLLEQFADNNSAAWMKDDGTLDEEKVREFLEQMGRIYQTGKEGVDQIKAAYPEIFDESQQPEYDRTTGIAGETVSLLTGTCLFAVGGVYSPFDFSSVVSFSELMENAEYQLWNGQVSDSFIPVNEIGVSSKSSQKETAMEFVQYLFSEEGQQLSKNDGFSVVEKVYDGADYWNQGEEGKVLASGGSSNSVTGQDINYEIKVPSADKVDALKQLGKTLTTPILDNAIITSAVTEAGTRYLNGEIGLDEAASAVIQQVNLYLAE